MSEELNGPAEGSRPPAVGHTNWKLAGIIGVPLVLVLVVAGYLAFSDGSSDDSPTAGDSPPGASSSAAGGPAGSASAPESGEGGSGGTDLGEGAADITIATCQPVSPNAFTAGLTIANPTADTMSYVATVVVIDSDGARIGELSAIARSIAAGETANVNAIGAVSRDSTEATCELASVERFAP